MSESADGDCTAGHGQGDYWIVKTNNVGAIQWTKNFGGSLSDIPTMIRQTSDSGFVAVGSSFSQNGDLTGTHNGSTDYWVIKLDKTGNLQWQKALGGTRIDMGTAIQQTNDLGFVVCGYSVSGNGDVTNHHGDSVINDYWVAKLDATGDIQWQKSLGGTNDDRSYAVIQTFDGGYMVAGNAGSNDGDVTSNVGVSIWLVKLNHEVGVKDLEQSKKVSFYPNPTKDAIEIVSDVPFKNVPFSIYDEVGRLMVSGTLNHVQNKVSLSTLPPGSYILDVAGYKPSTLIKN